MDFPKALLKADRINSMDESLSTHPLNPNAQRVSKRLGDLVGLQHLGFNLVTVQPGHDSTEYHRHLYEEECIYILSGTGKAEIDGEFYNVTVGDFMGFSRNGAAHSLTNNGDEPLIYLVTGQRLEQDICDYPHKKLRLYINGEKEDYVSLDDIHLQPPK